MKLTLNADGTVTEESFAGNGTGTWTNENGTITVTIDDSPASGELADGTLTLAAEGTTMVFTREATESITVADVKAAAAAEDFYGEWACKYVSTGEAIVDISAAGVVMPNVKLADGTVEFIGDDDNMYAMIFNLMGLTNAFEDGKLVLTTSIEGATGSGVAEMLEDGMMKLSLVADEETTMVIYYTPVN